MLKILYAINHEQTENAIQEFLDGNFSVAGKATYRESILDAIKASNPDVLLLREEIPGAQDILSLIESIRTLFSGVRIVFLSKKREMGDPFLASLVCMGVYDIINKDVVPVKTIVDYIKHPRNFGDVAGYYNGSQIVPHQYKEDSDEKKPGFLKSLFGGKASDNKTSKSSVVVVPDDGKDIDMDTMRIVADEAAAKRAQRDVAKLIDQETDKRLSGLKEELAEAKQKIESLQLSLNQSKSIDRSVRDDLEKAKVENASLEHKIHDLEEAAKKTAFTHQEQIKEMQTGENPKWFAGQIEKHEQEEAELKAKIEDMAAEIEALKQGIPTVDLSGAENEDFGESVAIVEKPVSERSTIVFVGGKHGVGNTTVALNTATSIASKGYKTIFIELNSSFPLLNHYFEFLNVSNGFDTAIQKISSNAISNTNQQESDVDEALVNNPITAAIAESIIEPHKLSGNRQLVKSYKKLPQTLNFMTFSNDYISRCASGNRPILSVEGIQSLIKFLKFSLGYAYVIIDIQPDDMEFMNSFVYNNQNNQITDKLVMTMTQDSHSLVTGKTIIDRIAQSDKGLAGTLSVVINKFDSKTGLSAAKITKWLNTKAIVKMSFDPAGYGSAGQYGIPYYLNKGKDSKDFDSLDAVLFKMK